MVVVLHAIVHAEILEQIEHDLHVGEIMQQVFLENANADFRSDRCENRHDLLDCVSGNAVLHQRSIQQIRKECFTLRPGIGPGSADCPRRISFRRRSFLRCDGSRERSIAGLEESKCLDAERTKRFEAPFW